MILAGVLGAGQAFFNPALTGLFPEMVSPGRLQQANALRGMALSTGTVIGPALAGLIVATGGPGWAIAIDAVTYAVSGCCLLRLDIPSRSQPDRTSILAQFAGGWNEFRSRSWLWIIVAQFASFNLFTYARSSSSAPSSPTTAWEAPEPGAPSWPASGSAASPVDSSRSACDPTVPWSSPPSASSPSPSRSPSSPYRVTPSSSLSRPLSPGWVCRCSTLCGRPPCNGRFRRRHCHEVSSYDWFGSIAFVPVGYALAGILAATIGVRPILLFGAGWVLVSCAVVLFAPSVRSLTSPSARGAPIRDQDPDPASQSGTT